MTPAPAPMVGRRAELASIERALRACAAGRGVLVEVSGEPGIGKTRLLAELANSARASGYRVLATHTSQVPPARGFDDLRGELLRQPALQPLALVVDDLHCVDMHGADRATIELIERLLNRPARGPTLLAVAYRPRQASPRLLAALARADPAGALRIELGPLAGPDAGELLRDADPDRHRDCLGNPFYLLALAGLDEAMPAGVIVDHRSAMDVAELPGPLRRGLIAEFAGLGPAGVAAAGAAAVAGERFDPELVTSITGTVEPSGLDELLVHDLVRAGGGGEFRFRHWLLRLGAYHLPSPTWRREAHRRAAAALRSRDAPLSALAPHVERYAVPGNRAAADELTAAARAAMSQDPASAARWLRAALRLNPCDRDGLRLELANALGLAGRLRESRAILHDVMPGSAGPGRRREARAVVLCATVERLLGHHAEARGLLLGELARQQGTRQDRAALVSELAIGALMRGDLLEVGRWAARAAGTATRRGELGIRATALGLLTMTSYGDGDLASAQGHLRAATAVVDSMTDRELAAQPAAALWLGWNEVYLERYHDAVRHLDRGLRLARDTGQGHLLPLVLACRSLAMRWLGRLPAAAASAEQAVAAAAGTGSDELMALAHAVQSWIASWVGDRATALDAGAAAVREAAGRTGWFAGLATAMLARSRLVTGRPGGSAAAIASALGGPDLTTVDPRSHASWWEVLVQAELAEGNLAAAAGFATRAELLAGRIDLAGHHGHARLARAHVLAAAGDPTAVESALAAAAAFATAGCPLEEGRARLLAATVLAGRAVLADGAVLVRDTVLVRDAELVRDTVAADQLGRARELFEDCGAPQLARQAARLGRRPPGRRGPGPPALPLLTPRERQAAGLVAEGLSNREIARRLDISERTVEKHLSQVMAKLGVGSRAGVAGLVGRAQGARAQS